MHWRQRGQGASKTPICHLLHYIWRPPSIDKGALPKRQQPQTRSMQAICNSRGCVQSPWPTASCAKPLTGWTRCSHSNRPPYASQNIPSWAAQATIIDGNSSSSGARTGSDPALTSSASAFFCMSWYMLRKPLLREGVRLCDRPIAVIHSGDSRATCSTAQPLRPCTSSAARPCGAHHAWL